MSARFATTLSWSFLLGAIAAFGVVVAETVLKDWAAFIGALATTGAFLAALGLFEAGRSVARRWGQRRIREGGLRDYSAGRSRRAQPAERVASNSARLDGHDEQLAAIREQVGFIVSTFSDVLQKAGESAPDLDQTQPLMRVVDGHACRDLGGRSA